MSEKASDIKELTDQMFSYALVSEEQETPDMSWLSTDFIFNVFRKIAISLVWPDLRQMLKFQK